MIQQLIATCITLAVLSGIMGVLATASLAHSAAQKQKGNKAFTCCGLGAFALSVLCQAGIAVFNISATWFGPVSIVVPTAASAQLLFNMVMFSVVLGLESFSKEMRVGAYVVVLAAILLPVVGPGVQIDQDVYRLMQQTGAVVWSGVLLGALVVSAIGLVVADKQRKRSDHGGGHSGAMFSLNVVAQTSGAVVGTTAAKVSQLFTNENTVAAADSRTNTILKPSSASCRCLFLSRGNIWYYAFQFGCFHH